MPAPFSLKKKKRQKNLSNLPREWLSWDSFKSSADDKNHTNGPSHHTLPPPSPAPLPRSLISS